MKYIYLLFFLAFSVAGSAQVVTADPAVGAMNLTDTLTKLDRSKTLTSGAVDLKLPVFNLNPYNPIPNGSTTLIIGLGSHLALDPKFNLSTARLSNYFSFAYSTTASQPRIIGTQIATIPKDFIDSTSFRVIGKGSGTSAASVNFSINPGGNVDDEDGNNNSTSVSYSVLITLPVSLSQFMAGKNACNVDVSFKTEEEKNVSRFEVEVSKDERNYIVLGQMPATGAGRYSRSYPITENLKAPLLYVRLKTVDKDGQVTYSSVIKIAGNCEDGGPLVLSLYPNPVSIGRTVTITSREGNFVGRYNVSLLDVNGRILQNRQIQLNGVSNFNFSLGNISSGHYLIRMTNLLQNQSAVIHFQK